MITKNSPVNHTIKAISIINTYYVFIDCICKSGKLSTNINNSLERILNDVNEQRLLNNLLEN